MNGINFFKYYTHLIAANATIATTTGARRAHAVGRRPETTARTATCRTGRQWLEWTRGAEEKVSPNERVRNRRAGKRCLHAIFLVIGFGANLSPLTFHGYKNRDLRAEAFADIYTNTASRAPEGTSQIQLLFATAPLFVLHGEVPMTPTFSRLTPFFEESAPCVTFANKQRQKPASIESLDHREHNAGKAA